MKPFRKGKKKGKTGAKKPTEQFNCYEAKRYNYYYYNCYGTQRHSLKKGFVAVTAFEVYSMQVCMILLEQWTKKNKKKNINWNNHFIYLRPSQSVFFQLECNPFFPFFSMTGKYKNAFNFCGVHELNEDKTKFQWNTTKPYLWMNDTRIIFVIWIKTFPFIV